MNETRFILPAGYSRIKSVESFAELLGTPFENGVNAICWARELSGDFSEVVTALGAGKEEIDRLGERELTALALSSDGRKAVQIMLQDLASLTDAGLAPELNCIYNYPRSDEAEILPTDVYSFHADSASHEIATFLCSYTAPSSEGLRNDEAKKFVEISGMREKLRESFGGRDEADFESFLTENCYHLHYQPIPAARPFSFGVGNLWRIAVEHPGSAVPPCIHRAPLTQTGQAARLLLIS